MRCSGKGLMRCSEKGSMRCSGKGSMRCSGKGSMRCSEKCSMRCSEKGSMRCSEKGSMRCSGKSSMRCSEKSSMPYRMKLFAIKPRHIIELIIIFHAIPPGKGKQIAYLVLFFKTFDIKRGFKFGIRFASEHHFIFEGQLIEGG